MSRAAEISESIEKVGGAFRGRKEILKHLAGEKVTTREGKKTASRFNSGRILGGMDDER